MVQYFYVFPHYSHFEKCIIRLQDQSIVVKLKKMFFSTSDCFVPKSRHFQDVNAAELSQKSSTLFILQFPINGYKSFNARYL